MSNLDTDQVSAWARTVVLLLGSGGIVKITIEKILKWIDDWKEENKNIHQSLVDSYKVQLAESKEERKAQVVAYAEQTNVLKGISKSIEGLNKNTKSTHTLLVKAVNDKSRVCRAKE